MRLKCLGCEVLARMIYHCAARSPHIVDVELFRFGLHSEPEKLGNVLQERIDACADEDYDAVIMGYGLCGKAVSGLTAKKIPLVIPRAHDCITLFLGGRDRYAQEFSDNPGTYWYAQDYIERKREGSDTLGYDPDDNIEEVYDDYVEKYGKDNADFLMETMGAWKSHYNRSAFIDLPTGADSGNVEELAKSEAERRGWTFERVAGELLLIQKLIFAEWDGDMLIVEPGSRITETNDENVVGCSCD